MIKVQFTRSFEVFIDVTHLIFFNNAQKTVSDKKFTTVKDLFQFQTNQANAVRLKDLRSNRKIRFLSLCILLEHMCADKQVNTGKERTKESKGFLQSLTNLKKVSYAHKLAS